MNIINFTDYLYEFIKHRNSNMDGMRHEAGGMRYMASGIGFNVLDMKKLKPMFLTHTSANQPDLMLPIEK